MSSINIRHWIGFLLLGFSRGFAQKKLVPNVHEYCSLFISLYLVNLFQHRVSFNAYGVSALLSKTCGFEIWLLAKCLMKYPVEFMLVFLR